MLVRMAEPILRHTSRRILSFRHEATDDIVPRPKPGRRYLLYVHVPYCEVLCPFCSFHRVAYKADSARRYFAALRDEIRRYHALGFDFAEVYVGGGTPTVNLGERFLRTARKAGAVWTPCAGLQLVRKRSAHSRFQAHPAGSVGLLQINSSEDRCILDSAACRQSVPSTAPSGSGGAGE